LLINSFLKENAGNAPLPTITDAAMSCLLHYDYPGNVRELKSVIQAAINLAQGRPITPALLPQAIRNAKADIKTGPSERACLPETLSAVEKQHILRVYKMMQQNKSKTARTLGIGLNTLRRKLSAYGVK
jgi:DNA-binding NtrC family response regulator